MALHSMTSWPRKSEWPCATASLCLPTPAATTQIGRHCRPDPPVPGEVYRICFRRRAGTSACTTHVPCFRLRTICRLDVAKAVELSALTFLASCVSHMGGGISCFVRMSTMTSIMRQIDRYPPGHFQIAFLAFLAPTLARSGRRRQSKQYRHTIGQFTKLVFIAQTGEPIHYDVLI